LVVVAFEENEQFLARHLLHIRLLQDFSGKRRHFLDLGGRLLNWRFKDVSFILV
jgi:hypothetical protein